jgi:hypothetical protein
MKSIIENAIYSGLGLLNHGTDAITNLGQQLAKKAGVSEAEGHKMARKLQVESSRAVRMIRKDIDNQVTHVADMIHAAIRADTATKKKKSAGHAKAPSKK